MPVRALVDEQELSCLRSPADAYEQALRAAGVDVAGRAAEGGAVADERFLEAAMREEGRRGVRRRGSVL